MDDKSIKVLKKGPLDGLILALIMILTLNVQAQEIVEVQDLRSNPGNLAMFTYRPRSAGHDSPLVILLHGCMQDAKSFAINTGWKEKADEFGITLLLPQQLKINNGANCFTWYNESDTVRDKGEMASISFMIDYMQASYPMDSSKIFVTGISAGSTLSSALMASYPERIKAGALVSGVSYGCATSLLNSYKCMFSPPARLAQTRGDYVRDASGNYQGKYPRVMIVHGKKDTIVDFNNGPHSLEQWLNVHDLPAGFSITETLSDGIAIERYQNGQGENSPILVESIFIEKAGHGWPINSRRGCGHRAQFFVEGELCLTNLLIKKWGIGQK